MKNISDERKDLVLRQKYENGEISADDFIKRLFSSREADRNRRKIVEKNEKSTRHLQQV